MIASNPLLRLFEIPWPQPRQLFKTPGGTLGAFLSPREFEPGVRMGALGFFELADPEDRATAHELLAQGCEFLKFQGARVALGPLHLNTWLPYRFALPHADPLHFAWEPNQHPAYPEHWRSFGFARAMLYFSEGHGGFGEFIRRIGPAHQHAVSQGYSFRPIRGESADELQILHRLSMHGFADNFLFEPLPETLFRELYVPAAERNTSTDQGLSAFVVSPEGREVGFSFSFVDRSQSDGRARVVLKTATVLPEHRGKGLSNALFYQTLHPLDPQAHPEFVSALVRQGAQSSSYGRHHPTLWRHEYELLSCRL